MTRPHIYPCNCHGLLGLLGPDIFRSMCSIYFTQLYVDDTYSVQRTAYTQNASNQSDQFIVSFGSCAATLTIRLRSPNCILFVYTQIIYRIKRRTILFTIRARSHEAVWQRRQGKDAKLRDENTKQFHRAEKNDINAEACNTNPLFVYTVQCTHASVAHTLRRLQYFNEMCDHDRWCGIRQRLVRLAYHCV